MLVVDGVVDVVKEAGVVVLDVVGTPVGSVVVSVVDDDGVVTVGVVDVGGGSSVVNDAVVHAVFSSPIIALTRQL